jgi:uncharacterized membrane protein
MAGTAYLLLPITGLLAYSTGRDERVRFHGLQAVTIGLVWPLAMIACSKITPGATQIAFALGAIVWLAFLVFTALGSNPKIPFVGRLLQRAAADDPRGAAGEI